MMISAPLSMAIYRGLSSGGGLTILSPGGISGLITYTQSGNLTYFDSTGTLQTAAVDTMVLDYDPSTLVLRGYPFWEQRTNIALWSRDATNAAWTKTNATATLTGTGLTGVANSASVLSATAADGLVYQNITVSASTTYTFTVYLKASSATTLTIFIFDPVFATLGSTVCNVTTSWQRFTVTAGTGANTGIKISIGGGSTFSTGEVVTMDCAQLEAGAFATPAILTTSAAITRAAPSCAITGTNFSSWYNQSQGTFVVASQQTLSGLSGAAFTGFDVSDNTNNNAIIATTQFGLSNFEFIITTGGVAQADLLAASTASASKRACAFKANDIAASYNGAAVLTDASATLPTVDRMHIGQLHSSLSCLNGWISSLSYYSARLPNSSLVSLST